jgi:hypothetical protein
MSVEVYVQDILARQALDNTSDRELHSIWAAIDRILELRKGSKLEGSSGQGPHSRRPQVLRAVFVVGPEHELGHSKVKPRTLCRMHKACGTLKIKVEGWPTRQFAIRLGCGRH